MGDSDMPFGKCVFFNKLELNLRGMGLLECGLEWLIPGADQCNEKRGHDRLYTNAEYYNLIV